MPRNAYHDTPVVEFHEAFGAPVAWHPTAPEEERRRLRCALLLEEALEFCIASGFSAHVTFGITAKGEPDHYVELSGGGNFDVVQAADALADIRYVTDGAALEWGIPLEKCLREVHRSNMSKLGEDGKPILRADGKILKGPNFTLPDLKAILDLYASLPNAGVPKGYTAEELERDNPYNQWMKDTKL